MGYKTVSKFVASIVGGSLISVFLGSYLDDCLNTRPFIMLILLLYVIVGSLYSLYKGASKTNGSKRQE